MKLRYQRLLYLSFMAIFAVLVPLVILYATGYSYNFKKHRLEKTGILFIESKPAKAQIFLNGTYRGLTPQRLTALPPDTYQTRLAADGYFDWNKTLEVQSNRTTFARTVLLFRNTQPVNINSGEVGLFVVDGQNQRLLYTRSNPPGEEARLYDLRTHQDQLLYSLPAKEGKLTDAAWSVLGSTVSLTVSATSSRRFLLVDAQTADVTELAGISQLPFTRLKWDTDNDQVLYGLHASVVSRIDLASRTSKTILSGAVADVVGSGQYLYYLTEQKDGAIIHRRDLDSASPEEKIKLPAASGYEFLPAPSDYLALRGPNGTDSLVMDTQAFGDEDLASHIVVQEPAKNIVWLADADKLLLVNNFELATLELASRSRETLTRYSQPIDLAVWHPSKGWVFYSLGNQLKVIETSGQTKNDLVLATFSEIDDVVVDPIGEFVYIKGKLGNQEGLFRLELQ